MQPMTRALLLLLASLLLPACVRSSPPTAPTGATPTPARDPAATPASGTQAPDSTATPPGTPAPAAKRAPGQENEPLQAWRGFGNEPFWQARVDGETLVFSTPDDPDGRAMTGRRVPSLVGYVFIGQDGDKSFHLGLTPGTCSDGMSDNRYEFVATFLYGDVTYKGCGEVAK